MFNSISVGGKGNDALVVAHFVDADSKPLGFDKATLRKLASHGLAEQGAQALALPEATGESGALAEVPGNKQYKRLIVVGLGKAAGFDAGSLRTVAGNLGRRLAAVKAGAVTVEIAGALKDAGVSPKAAGLGVGEGLGLLGWVCDQFRGSATPAPKRTDLSLTSDDARFLEGVQRGLALAVSTNLTRTLSRRPPTSRPRRTWPRRPRSSRSSFGLKCTVMEGDALKKEKLDRAHRVGKASENKPCMIRLEYTPKKAGKKAEAHRPHRQDHDLRHRRPLAQDQQRHGGHEARQGRRVRGPGRDARDRDRHQARRPVVALLAARRTRSPTRPTAPTTSSPIRNGVTVEVTNTDAEGRLVLADALCWACEKETPRTSSTSPRSPAAWWSRWARPTAACSARTTACAARSRPRPALARRARLAPAHARGIPRHDEEPVADILNSNPNRKAHPIQGAAFLSYFVTENVPWCHLDIAGVHVAEKNAGPYVEGPTGWGVRRAPARSTRRGVSPA
jgi:leucyl aminopeptidase